MAEIRTPLSPSRDTRQSPRVQCPAYIKRLQRGDELNVSVPSSVLLSVERPDHDDYSAQFISLKLATSEIRVEMWIRSKFKSILIVFRRYKTEAGTWSAKYMALHSAFVPGGCPISGFCTPDAFENMKATISGALLVVYISLYPIKEPHFRESPLSAVWPVLRSSQRS